MNNKAGKRKDSIKHLASELDKTPRSVLSDNQILVHTRARVLLMTDTFETRNLRDQSLRAQKNDMIHLLKAPEL